MTAQIIPFDFEDTPVRAVMRDGATWWVAADVCRVLEIGNSRDALSRLESDEKDGVGITDAIGRTQTTNVVNESGLYALIMTSRKPAARRFRKWVTAEVLPTLRREGQYKMPSQEAKEEISAKRLIELLEAENELLRQQAGKRRARKAPVPTTEEERAEIKRLIEERRSVSEVSRMTGRSASMISMFRTGMAAKSGGAA
ncbi:MAG: BRO-N domain-containing protein [Pelagimonas sp.]|uniref:BRO-N domain-containing protein n=1 Tax=Pelagimonas sp. TaxID=2073170 RepID=UPI003D6A7EB5